MVERRDPSRPLEKTILIVHNEKDAHIQIIQTLTSEGHNTIEAECGSEALTLAAREKIDLNYPQQSDARHGRLRGM